MLHATAMMCVVHPI